jgi:hypothetical protein
MQDKKTAQQEFLKALLKLEAVSLENLTLLKGFLDATLGAAYAKNAELVKSAKTGLSAAVKKEMLLGTGSSDMKKITPVKNQLDKTILSLNQINNSRKQLLADAERVRLSVTMISGENLPKAQGKLYQAGINKILEKVNNMSLGLDKSSVELNMHHGVNLANLNKNDLKKLQAGVQTNIDSVLNMNEEVNKELKDERLGKTSDKKEKTIFTTPTLKRGRSGS